MIKHSWKFKKVVCPIRNLGSKIQFKMMHLESPCSVARCNQLRIVNRWRTTTIKKEIEFLCRAKIVLTASIWAANHAMSHKLINRSPLLTVVKTCQHLRLLFLTTRDQNTTTSNSRRVKNKIFKPLYMKTIEMRSTRCLLNNLLMPIEMETKNQQQQVGFCWKKLMKKRYY